MIAELVDTRYKRISAGLTVLLFILLFILLFLYTISFPDPMPEVEPRIEIIPLTTFEPDAGGNAGSDGGSDNETPYEQPINENPTPTPNTTSTQHVTTQENSNVSVPSGNSTTQQTVNQNALFTKPTGTGTGTGTGDHDGPGAGHGNEPGTGTTAGTGIGPGTGPYQLGGRAAKEKPAPNNVTLNEGKIVVTIWVDPSGKVVRTKINRDKSTIIDSKLEKECEKAAMNTTWAPDPNAPDEQAGLITYTFKVN